MNRVIIKYLTLLSIVFLSNYSFSQVDYTLVLKRAKVNGMPEEFINGDPDPTYITWHTDDTRGFSSDFCKNFGGINDNTWTNSFTNLTTPACSNTMATQITLEVESFEDDRGSDCSFDGPNFLGIEDDEFIPRTTLPPIDFLLDRPCQENVYTFTLGAYSTLEYSVTWNFTVIDPGGIGGDQYACPGGDPAIFTSLSDGIEDIYPNWCSFQWQMCNAIGAAAVANDPNWFNITGATDSVYDPALGFNPGAGFDRVSYRRILKTPCGDDTSNIISVIIPDPPSPPASAASNPSIICGSGPVQLIGNSGGTALPFGTDFQWYAGDPNAGGIPIGTGSPLTVMVTTPTLFFVRIENLCYNSGSQSTFVNISTPPTAPIGVISSAASICEGDNVLLTVNGGSLGTTSSGGTGGVYAWYDSDPTVMPYPTPLSTGAAQTYSITPASTQNYFVRIEACDTTAYVSIPVVVNNDSDPSTYITASVPSICPGDNVTLTANGGTLGTGAVWRWYENGCGAGPPIGTGLNITVNPNSNTQYFVRAEGSCNITTCSFYTVVVNDVSTIPGAVTVSDPLVCPGGTSTLTVVGGSLGGVANWKWYEGSCGGILVGTGPVVSVNPMVTTDYYVRAEGGCNTTACFAVRVDVKSQSTDPVSATASINNICANDATTLTVSGGILGAGATWKWYEGSCGGVYVGNNATITVNPTVTTTYYARAEGECNTSACANVTVNVKPVSLLPTSIGINNPTACPGTPVQLSVIGGTLLATDTWEWYEGGCGNGPSLGSGPLLIVSPLVPTSYFVRAEGPCGATNCISLLVSPADGTTAANTITVADADLCVGQNTLLSVSGGNLGPGASWKWYAGVCGGSLIGNGNAITVAPSATTTYFVRGEGPCGNTACVNTTVTVGAGIAGPLGIVASNLTPCPREPVQLTVNGGALPADHSWVWYSQACGAVAEGTGLSIVVEPTVTTTYYVTAIGPCGPTNCEEVTIAVQPGSIPPSSISTSLENPCRGQSVTLTLVDEYLDPGAQWVWYEGACPGTFLGTPVGYGNVASFTPEYATTYFVRSEGGLCGNTICVSLFVNTIPVVVHFNPIDTLCGLSSPFLLNGGEPEGGSYSGVGVTNDIFHPNTAGYGVHTLRYTYTSDNNCTGTVDKNVVIVPTPMEVSVTQKDLPCSEGGMVLEAVVTNSEGILTYRWSDGDYTSEKINVQPGTYVVQVSDLDGCIAMSDSIIVSDDMTCLDISNVVTPNGDGVNDTWDINLTQYTDAETVVFSKWGREVYRSSILDIKWDCTNQNGQPLPSGVYYYVVEVERGVRSQNGVITIIR